MSHAINSFRCAYIFLMRIFIIYFVSVIYFCSRIFSLLSHRAAIVSGRLEHLKNFSLTLEDSFRAIDKVRFSNSADKDSVFVLSAFYALYKRHTLQWYKNFIKYK